MCGFVGFTASGELGDDLELAARMLGMIAHRGPYGSFAYRHHGLMLAHCALPFVDPAGCGQPFLSGSGRTAVVFNGEIYNYRELRAELIADGVRLRTGGDTELLVELYEREGMSFLSRLRGMYAFVLHDADQQRLVLVRDTFGKKPLYYWHAFGRTVFASELGALLAHPDCSRLVDPVAVADYLTLQAFPAPGTVLAGVHKVRPGAYVTIDKDGVQETVFARPLLSPVRRRRGLREDVDGLERTLRAAVARRLHTTAQPLGILLSGGLDSSVVAALVCAEAGSPLPMFCARFTDPAFDESPHAEVVARHLGARLHTVSASTGELAEVADAELRRIDEPLADPSLLPMLLVSRDARRVVRAVLTGDGADEVLLGYRFFQAERVMEGLARLMPVDLLARAAARSSPGPVARGNLPPRAALAALLRGVRAAPERRFYESTRPFSQTDLVDLFTPEAAEAIGAHAPYRELDRFLDGAGTISPLERSQLALICHFLRDTILAKVDRASMRFGLEARSPFLDADVAEFCGTLPVDRKLRGLTGKYVLRRLADRWLPREISTRRKLGFRAPVAALLAGELATLLQDTLSPAALRRAGLFRPDVVNRLLVEQAAASRDHTRKLWALLCFQLWYDGVLVDSTRRPRIDVTLMGVTDGGRADSGHLATHMGPVWELSGRDSTHTRSR